jgi:hypothetical protein
MGTYKISIKISGHKTDRAELIKDAVGHAVRFNEWRTYGFRKDNVAFLTMESEIETSISEHPSHFARAATRLAWSANGAYCKVELTIQQAPIQVCIEEHHYREQPEMNELLWEYYPDVMQLMVEDGYDAH